jgi:predicted CXXCH cytochrome family protein
MTARSRLGRISLGIGAALMLAAVVIGLRAGGALAAAEGGARPSGAQPIPPASGSAQGISNDSCFACHSTPGMTMTLPSGEQLYLTVDRDTYNNSVHGQLGYACVQCHTDITGYPHPKVAAQTMREFTLEKYTACAVCHQDKYQQTLDSVHQKALAAGNINAAVCTDCHGAHDVQPPDQPRTRIPQTCEKCHSQIYDLYKDSVHGAALISEGNPDVPTCTDCHGVHDIEGPSNSPFRLFSPQICARCHANKQLMDKYGISTDVFSTYVSDFHGTTVVIFEAIAPDQQTNKPVCIDCHGVHDILPPTDPNSTVMKANLLKTCQKCHPDATTNFPTAWMSHYEPSPQHFALVYYVQLFYKILIPTVIGGMLVFVVADGVRRIRIKRKGRSDE